MRKVLLRSARLGPSATATPKWLNFQGSADFVAASPSGRARVYVDHAGSAEALQNAKDLVQDADRVAAAIDTVFATSGQPVNVIVYALEGRTDGSGGGDHTSCDFATGQDIEVCASFGNSARVSALFAAELSECYMGGHLCFCNTGEGLSRWCAASVSNNALPDFATGPAWFDNGKHDYVTKTDPTDEFDQSTGCAVVFLSWLLGLTSLSGLENSFSLRDAAQAMAALGDSATLADLYAKLTEDSPSNALARFRHAVDALPFGVKDDDPFGGLPSAIHSLTGASLQPSRVAPAVPAVSAGSVAADLAYMQLSAHDVPAIVQLRKRTQWGNIISMNAAGVAIGFLIAFGANQVATAIPGLLGLLAATVAALSHLAPQNWSFAPQQAASTMPSNPPTSAVSPRKIRIDPVPISLFLVGVALGGTLGFYAKQHHFLEERPSTAFQRNWGDFGIDKKDFAQRALDHEYPVTAVPRTPSPLSHSEAKSLAAAQNGAQIKSALLTSPSKPVKDFLALCGDDRNCLKAGRTLLLATSGIQATSTNKSQPPNGQASP